MSREILNLREARLAKRETISLLNTVLYYDFIDPQLYVNTVENDPNHRDEDFYILYENSEPAAVAYVAMIRVNVPGAEKYMNHAWLKALGTIPGKEALLPEILSYIEGVLRDRGAEILHIYNYAPWYLTTGMDVRYALLHKILRENNYIPESRAVNYYIDMDKFYTPIDALWSMEKLRREGYTVKHAKPSTLPKIQEWIHRKFGVIWSIEAGLTKDKIDAGLLYVTNSDGEIIGFSVYGATAPYRFGPIGVDEKHRGKGVGKALLYQTLQEMRKTGVRIAEIPWTTHLFFYASIPGITSIRSFIIYKKQL